MNFTGFTEKDFAVFHVDGLEDRMNKIKEEIQPKLNQLGLHFAPTLATLTGDEIYHHVAKHARRSVNPPNDTWVAFANNKRGYKMLPHFQIGLWQSHVFIWFALIYEANNKAAFGKTFENHLSHIYETTPPNYVWSIDHMKPNVTAHGSLTKEQLQEMFIRLQSVKKAELLCGYHLPKEEAIKLSGDAFIQLAEQVFKNVLPLYKNFQ